jgi:hypothetical protein
VCVCAALLSLLLNFSSSTSGRDKAKEMVDKALAVGDRSTAWQQANKCVDVSPDLAYQLILVITNRQRISQLETRRFPFMH